MTINKNVEKYLWILGVLFVTCLLLGSFIISKNVLELAYLAILYSSLIAIKLVSLKK